MHYEVFHCGWLEQAPLLYEVWGSFQYFRWSFHWFQVVFTTCVLISAYLWSFGIAVSLQTSAASVSLVSQLRLLNEGEHQAPCGLLFHVSQPRNSPGRQLGQSQGSFHLNPLRGHCPSLADIQCFENTPSKWQRRSNLLFHVLSLFSCFR